MGIICTVISLVGLGLGFFIALKPALSIEIQRKFYAKINWKIEPISMPREIRNTRIMGLFLIAFSIFTLLFIFSYKSLFYN